MDALNEYIRRQHKQTLVAHKRLLQHLDTVKVLVRYDEVWIIQTSNVEVDRTSMSDNQLVLYLLTSKLEIVVIRAHRESAQHVIDHLLD